MTLTAEQMVPHDKRTRENPPDVKTPKTDTTKLHNETDWAKYQKRYSRKTMMHPFEKN